MILLQQILNGLMAGGTYAAVALGFTLVVGVLRLLNMAHPQLYMLGAFTGYSVAVYSGASFPFVLLAGFLGGGVAGIAIERLVLRPLKGGHFAAPFIATLGVAMFLENLIVRFFGPQQHAMPPIISDRIYSFAGLQIGKLEIITLVFTISLMAGLLWFVVATWTGKAIRATSEDAEAASFLGVNVGFVSWFTVGLAGGMAGATGILIASLYNMVNPFMATTMGLKALVVVIIGGMGNIFGALLAGLGLGILESLITGFVSSTYRDAIAFGVLLIILLVRPEGLLGERLRRK